MPKILIGLKVYERNLCLRNQIYTCFLKMEFFDFGRMSGGICKNSDKINGQTLTSRSRHESIAIVSYIHGTFLSTVEISRRNDTRTLSTRQKEQFRTLRIKGLRLPVQ